MKNFIKLSILSVAMTLTTMSLVLAKPMVNIEDIVINRNMDGNTVEGLNIRVNLENEGSDALENPIVTLWVRRDWKDNWRLLETWNHHDNLDAGARHTHDYFANGTGFVDPALFNETFEVKAVVIAENHRGETSQLGYYPDLTD